jgi:hypothetical protein
MNGSVENGSAGEWVGYRCGGVHRSSGDGGDSQFSVCQPGRDEALVDLNSRKPWTVSAVGNRDVGDRWGFVNKPPGICSRGVAQAGSRHLL